MWIRKAKESGNKYMAKINILGVQLNNLSKAEALNKVKEYLVGAGQHQIVTPNPEIILAASRDREFFNILNRADLAVADGVALKFAAWLKGKNLVRIAGADLTQELLSLAEQAGKKVVIFNWRDGLSRREEISRALADKYSKLAVLVVDIGRQEPVDFIQANAFAPEIIFCTLGFPFQEKFIFYNLPNLPTAKIGLGVGGSFDFLTGKLPRAPLWLRRIGLEWLWRLIKQPRRWKRIVKAVIIFPIKFLIYYFKKYR